MYPWDCCRLCLSVQSLHPIFSIPEQQDKYTDRVFAATGIKVEPNDSLPQHMCSTCINYIDDSYKFRKKCEENQKTLRDRLTDKQIYEIKIEPNNIENDRQVMIDISDDVNDLKTQNDEEFNESNDAFERDEEPIIVFKSKNSKKTEKPVRRKLRSKKESGGKKEREKEEIECEYCHKILTSKLSLRNHYKIHTGFDVVCEHCGKKFITRRLLLMHCRAKHGYEKTDKCSFCDYRASNAEQVKIHERLHTGEKPYACAECGAGFHRRSSYLQHVAIHLPDKTVQCDQCPARFKSVTLMRIHKNRHRAPQYTFQCRVCDNSFARRRNVARHLQRIHGLQPDHQHIHRVKIA